MKTLRERLRHAWMQSRKSQTEIARECRVKPAAVSQWMSEGKQKATTPTYENLVLFAVATDTTVNWLLTGEPPEKKNGTDESGQSDRVRELDLENLLQAVKVVEKFLPSRSYKLRADDRVEVVDRIRKLLAHGPPQTAEILRIVMPLREKFDRRRSNGRAQRGNKRPNQGRHPKS